jgi:ABC-type transport system involved in multi-copper enzyme maturation permease subunit
MVWEIAKKNYYLNLISARFMVCFVLCIFLVPYTVYTGSKMYESRLSQYQKDTKAANEIFDNALTYSQIRPTTVLPPTPLSIFSKGITEQTGSKAELSIDNSPVFAYGITTMYENPFLNSIVCLDFINIMAIILSLLGLFLSYDLFSGERESGTLKLLLSNRIKRSTFFIGKVSGVFLTFLPVLLISYLMVLVIINLSAVIHLSANDYLRLLLLFIITIFFFGFFVFLGSYISSKAKQSSTSIVINLLAWCFLLFILPAITTYLGKNIVKTRDYNEVQYEEQEAFKPFWKEYEGFIKKTRDEGLQATGWNVSTGWLYGPTTLCFTEIGTVNYERRLHELSAPAVLKYADCKWQVQQHYLNQLYRQQRVIKYLSCLSPSELMKNIAASICKTDMESHVDFMDQSRNYRKQYFNYMKEKKIFSSTKYFCPHDAKDIPKDWGEANLSYEKWQKEKKPKSTFDLSSLRNLDISGLPRFHYRDKKVIDNLKEQLVLELSLVVVTLLLLWATFRSFIKFDVR